MEVQCVGVRGLVVWHSPAFLHIVAPTLQSYSISRAHTCVHIDVVAAVPHLVGWPLSLVGEKCPLPVTSAMKGS
jgi:hypothetical protein